MCKLIILCFATFLEDFVHFCVGSKKDSVSIDLKAKDKMILSCQQLIQGFYKNACWQLIEVKVQNIHIKNLEYLALRKMRKLFMVQLSDDNFMRISCINLHLEILQEQGKFAM